MSHATLATASSQKLSRSLTKPRLGFLGVGWIGRNRMEALLQTGAADAPVIGEPNRELAAKAKELAPDAATVDSLDQMLEFDLDAVVIATPSAMHAEQSIKALENGLAVFCQKPLGRNASENAQVIEAARRADRLLGVDLTYRYLTEVQRVRNLIRNGELGEIFAIDLVFHNAYGPDKEWFYKRSLSGGGCVVDLGIHLVDLALWTLDFPEVSDVTARLFCKGKPVSGRSEEVEDYAMAQFALGNGASAQLACSWRLPAGQDAVISATFYGTRGGARISNSDCSFYRFRAEHLRGTSREIIAEDAAPWGGRAVVDWLQRLNSDPSFDPAIEHLIPVAETLDNIYSAGGVRG